MSLQPTQTRFLPLQLGHFNTFSLRSPAFRSRYSFPLCLPISWCVCQSFGCFVPRKMGEVMPTHPLGELLGKAYVEYSRIRVRRRGTVVRNMMNSSYLHTTALYKVVSGATLRKSVKSVYAGVETVDSLSEQPEHVDVQLCRRDKSRARQKT